MREIGAFAAKNNLGALLDEVEQGGEILITRHGRPVARLVPATVQRDPAPAVAALERIRTRAQQLDAAKYDWPSIKADRDAGRP